MKKEINFILFLFVLILLCSAGLFLCFEKERTIQLHFNSPDEMLSVIPGDSASAADSEFTMRLPPNRKHRRYDLKIYNVAFAGGSLTFEDMNEGQWEYRIDGGEWLPLILSKGERVLETGVSAGEKTLSLRASDNLDTEAAAGKLNFKLKLVESPVNIILSILIGAATGGLLILIMYITAKKFINK